MVSIVDHIFEDLGQLGPVCQFLFASKLAMGPIISGSVGISYLQHSHIARPCTHRFYRPVLVCKQIGGGCWHFLFARLAGFREPTDPICYILFASEWGAVPICSGPFGISSLQVYLFETRVQVSSQI